MAEFVTLFVIHNDTPSITAEFLQLYPSNENIMTNGRLSVLLMLQEKLY